MIDPDTVAVDYNVPSIDRIMGGLAIIRRHCSEGSMCAEHDIIYYGGYADTIEAMTDDEQRAMFAFGWFESDESWAFFV